MFPLYQADLPPTDFALRMRPVFILLLVTLSLLITGKFIIHDFWGAVNLLFVVLMGLFLLSGPSPINVSSAPFFCLMATVSGIFDTVTCILYFHHSLYSIFDPKAPTLVLLAQSVFLISPVALLVSAALSYAIFMDCRENGPEVMPLAALARMEWQQQLLLQQQQQQQQQQSQQQQEPPSAPDGQGAEGPNPPQRAAQLLQQPVRRTIVPFQGQGMRLGDA
uniref:Uncharacterized protein n=1 Tax=Alexandrium monilatum TaxID=311494 RepID=A0A7S4REQ6_9DINO|mmetsp:Transcript_95859/g.295717  ORF Transcript_95859/g.295717 Transcript_95859/m.295717 type:complete len:221 (+) Transcript_95859:133-795(+)